MIPVIIFIADLFLFFIVHIVIAYGMESVGFNGYKSKSRKKKLKLELKKASKFERLMCVIQLEKAQSRLGYVFFMFICNIITVIIGPLFSLCVMVLLYWKGSMITIMGHEINLYLWGLGVPLYWLLGYAGLTLIPDLLFNPEERKRYGLK